MSTVETVETSLLRLVEPESYRLNPLIRAAKALGLLPLARAHRRRLSSTRFVGVTGSAGKTTTKALLAEVLSSKGTVTTSPGTFSTPVVAAKTVLATRRSDAFCVQEMGLYGPQSLDRLLWPIEPDAVVITNIGWDHRGVFRTQEAIAAQKAKLVAATPANGVVVLNGDDPHVRDMAKLARGRVVLYGSSADADLRVEGITARFPEPLSFTAIYEGRRYPVRTQFLGAHWVGVVLAALAGGAALGVPLQDATTAIAGFPPIPHRLSIWRTADGPEFLLDDFKGTEWTLPASLEVLATSTAQRRVAVIGYLADTRRKPRPAYKDAARAAREAADLVVLVGAWARYGLRARTTGADRSILAFESVEEAAGFLREELRAGDLVLIKASGVQHLQRLAFQFEVPTQCWLSECPKNMFCESCAELTSANRSGLASLHVSSPGQRDGRVIPSSGRAVLRAWLSRPRSPRMSRATRTS